jgi:hypothetical protein
MVNQPVYLNEHRILIFLKSLLNVDGSSGFCERALEVTDMEDQSQLQFRSDETQNPDGTVTARIGDHPFVRHA